MTVTEISSSAPEVPGVLQALNDQLQICNRLRASLSLAGDLVLSRSVDQLEHRALYVLLNLPSCHIPIWDRRRFLDRFHVLHQRLNLPSSLSGVP